MAIFSASTKPLGRSRGRTAIAAAAYRTGVVLVEEATGLVHDYSRRRGVDFVQVVTPDGRAVDREALWNEAERVEKRKDSRTAREWMVALPYEISEEGRAALTLRFASLIASRFGVAVDVAIHAPSHDGDARNFHAHLLCTTRCVTVDEAGSVTFGAKATIEIGDKDRKKAGIVGRAAADITELRTAWASMVNEALAQAGVDTRIDHRSLKAQRAEAVAAGDHEKAEALDREPTLHVGVTATAIERKGRVSRRGQGNRDRLARNAQRHAGRSRTPSEPQKAVVGSLSTLFPSIRSMRRRSAQIEDAVRRQAALDVEAERVRRARDQEEADAADRRRREAWDRYLASTNTIAPGDASTSDFYADSWATRRAGWLARRYGDADLVRRLQARSVHLDWVAFGPAGDDVVRIRIDDSTLIDDGQMMKIDRADNQAVIDTMVEIALAKGWTTICLNGGDEFIRRSVETATAAGLLVTKINGQPVDDDDHAHGVRPPRM